MTSGAFTPKVRWIIIGRDTDEHGVPRCLWCGEPVVIDWGEYSLQHRRARGMGGSKLADTGQAHNGALVHGSATTGCHHYIESHPKEAAARGFRIPQGSNPARIPLITWDGRELYLTPDGRAVTEQET